MLGGDWHTQVVTGPLGRPVDARWLMLPDRTAVVESAAAVGLPLVDPAELDPLRASTRGVGELLLAALRERPRSVLVGVGGTATVDGGAGLREVLHSWPSAVPLRVACDVRSPLLGARGAARVFGPQKGADEPAIEELESRLAALVDLVPFRDLPGAGAGGGLGAGLAALGGELVPGAELVLAAIGFDKRAKDAKRRHHRGGNRRRDDQRGQGRRARSSGVAPSSASAASCSAASCGTASRRTRSRAIPRAPSRTSCRSASA